MVDRAGSAPELGGQAAGRDAAAASERIIAVFSENDVTLDTETSKDKQVYQNDALLAGFLSDKYAALLDFGFLEKDPAMTPSLAFLHSLAAYFVERLASDPDIEITRTAPALTADEAAALLEKTPYAIGFEFIGPHWLAGIWEKLGLALAAELAAFVGSVAEYLLVHNSQINVVGRVFFHLVENKSEDYPFAFLATYSKELEEEAAGSAAGAIEGTAAGSAAGAAAGAAAGPAEGTAAGSLKGSPKRSAKGRAKKPTGVQAQHLPLQNALLEFQDDQERLLQLLSTVSRAAEQSDFISELVESGELFSPLRFTAAEAYTFLKEIPLYQECGIMCRMPDWWKKRQSSVQATLAIGEREPSRIGLDALLSFDLRLSCGGVEISRDELAELLSMTDGLALIKGKWVEIDHQRLAAVLAACDSVSGLGGPDGLGDELTLAEAMRLQMGLSQGGSLANSELIETTNGEWLRGYLDNLGRPDRLSQVAPGHDFKATLRDYQQTGLDWLATMRGAGFGALLADDMGLGKTIQVLALLEHLRRSAGAGTGGAGASTGAGAGASSDGAGDGAGAGAGGGLKALLVVPASLIGNWTAEIERFAPKLRYHVLHEKGSALLPQDIELFITTYGMATRLELLKEELWDVLVLDEAQAIKNPATKQTKAVKAIPARFRIALTGTPVENQMSDLWSLFDFLNAGLLGSSKEFTRFAKELRQNESYGQLRKVIQPFILRRLKTDRAIVSDLPEKVEMKSYATLTKKQAVLYTGLVDELAQAVEAYDGIKRRGIVLASLMKFKQICNHPDQLLGQRGFDPGQSGKFKVLEEICETVREKHERLLLFTQFREVCEPLAEYLATLFGRPGLVLHGQTPVKARGGLVARFNSEEYVPFMVLSLKAGGVGLNLTAANHVVHFDRWWNPAVENQATDRAFRIGQKKNVIVHKLITTGTVEEKIDRMIEDKLALTNELIASSGENWITEMDNRDLIKLFTLETTLEA